MIYPLSFLAFFVLSSSYFISLICQASFFTLPSCISELGSFIFLFRLFSDLVTTRSRPLNQVFRIY